MDVGPDNVKSCATGSPDAKKDAYVLGDSYAIAWLPAVRKALQPLGWRVHSLTMQECPATSVPVVLTGGSAYPECDAHRKWALQHLVSEKPDLIILADTDATVFRLASEARGYDAKQEITKGMTETLKALQPYASRTLILSSPPAGKALQSCVTRLSAPSDCRSFMTRDWWAYAEAQKAAATQGKARFLDTHLWFCSESGSCPGFVGTVPTRFDGLHLTTEYSESLAPLLREETLSLSKK
jgi:hypothetical protein